MRPAGRDRARSGRAAALAALAIVGLMAASRSMQRAPGSAPAAKALQQRRSSRDVAAAWAGEGDHGPLLDIEVWARPVNAAAAAPSNPLRALLSEKEQRGLVQLCGRCLYHSLKHVTHPRDLGGMTFVATGDLPLMWTRDSAVQLGVLLPRMARRPAIRALVEGGIRTSAFYIVQDPYAQGYEPHWIHPHERHKGDRIIGRGGWVAVRNYELDSGAYFFNLLHNFFRTEGLYRPEVLLGEPMVFEAAKLIVDTWVVEQHHEKESPYRFSELPREGLGTPVNYTGMTWSGFRPSDDPTMFGYSIPSNMYAAGALERALAINRQVWRNQAFESKASKLLADIKAGLERYGKVKTPEGQVVYAYEVDGRGGSLIDFDDPNLPSLVGMPLLGFSGYDDKIYRATRARLLNATFNSFYYSGNQFSGLGSPHTSDGMVWALGVFSEAFTAPTPEGQARALRTLLKMQCQDGLMHESVHVDDLGQCSRKWFEWANALLVVAVEQLLGADCDKAAQAFHMRSTEARERKDTSHVPQNGGPDLGAFYAPFTAQVTYDGKYESKVPTHRGIGTFVQDQEAGAEGLPEEAVDLGATAR